MSESYRKVVIRWNRMAGVAPAILLFLIGIAVQIVFVRYMIAHGLEFRYETISIGNWAITVSPLWLVIGAAPLVLVSSWMYVVDRTAVVPTRRRRFEYMPTLRMIVSATLIVGVFAVSLYVPYLAWSLWDAGYVSAFCRAFPQLTQTVLQVYAASETFSNLRILWKFALSENISAAIAVVTALIAAGRGPASRP